MFWAWELVVILVGMITFFEWRRMHSSALVFWNGADNTSLHPTSLLFTGSLSDLGRSATLIYGPMLQSLFWSFSTVYRRGWRCLLMTVQYPTSLICWNGADNTSLHPTSLLFTGSLSVFGRSTTLIYGPMERVEVLINDSRVSDFVNLLEHRRNMACVSLFYRHYNGRCFREIRSLVLYKHIFLRTNLVLAEHILLWLIVQ